MRDTSSAEIVLDVRDLDRSRSLYLRLGFVEGAGTQRSDSCVLVSQQTRVKLVQHPRTGEASAGHDEPSLTGRRSGQILTVRTSEIDEIYRYWQEEGMLITSPLSGTGAGRTFSGLDHDGRELRLEEVG